MAELKNDFRDWLVNTKKVRDGTASAYIRQISHIYKKNFGIDKYYLDNSNWNILSENILPLLIKYYELTNREYFIDRVTIWHALDYFDQVIGFINTSKQLNKNCNQTVKLYLHCYEGDFYIDSVNLENLRDYVQLFNSLCYKRDEQLKQLSSEEIRNFLNKIEKIIAENNIKDSSVYDSALHIIYPYRSPRLEKTALTNYCSFLYNKTGLVQYDYQNNTFMNLVTTQNPATAPKNYDIVHKVTGKRPMEIAVKADLALRHDDPEYTLTLKNLAEIFNTSETSGINLLEKYQNSYPHKTVLRDYYSINVANECLKQYYYKISNPHQGVNYELEGYRNYWCNRAEALNILKIGQEAFYSQIGKTKNKGKYWKSCSHVEYSPQAPKYYKADLEYLATLPEFKRLARNKNLKYNK